MLDFVRDSAKGTSNDRGHALWAPPPVDLHASIYAAMGISPQANFVVERRPFYVTEDGHGKVVRELFERAPVRARRASKWVTGT